MSPAPRSIASSNHSRAARAAGSKSPSSSAVSSTSLRSLAACRSLKLGGNRVASTLARLARTAGPIGKAAAAAANGKFEAYKSSHHFDSTYEHPEWLG